MQGTASRYSLTGGCSAWRDVSNLTPGPWEGPLIIGKELVRTFKGPIRKGAPFSPPTFFILGNHLSLIVTCTGAVQELAAEALRSA